MRCLLCEDFSITHICKNCQRENLIPEFIRRELFDGVEVFSFYKYDAIKQLLHTKHTDLGYYVYDILAQNSFAKFAKNFEFDEIVASLSVDDEPKENYSHTAILNKHLTSYCIKPLYARLVAQNQVSYSGKSKSYRLANKRDFDFKDFKQNSCILVDDIITTGTTLSEAIATCKKHHKEVLFCLTLADARK